MAAGLISEDDIQRAAARLRACSPTPSAGSTCAAIASLASSAWSWAGRSPGIFSSTSSCASRGRSSWPSGHGASATRPPPSGVRSSSPCRRAICAPCTSGSGAGRRRRAGNPSSGTSRCSSGTAARPTPSAHARAGPARRLRRTSREAGPGAALRDRDDRVDQAADAVPARHPARGTRPPGEAATRRGLFVHRHRQDPPRDGVRGRHAALRRRAAPRPLGRPEGRAAGAGLRRHRPALAVEGRSAASRCKWSGSGRATASTRRSRRGRPSWWPRASRSSPG